MQGRNPRVKNFLRFVFFCFVGGASFLIDWSLFNLFYKFGADFLIAITLSTALSMIFNFSVNRNITFSAKGKSVRKQIFRWLIIYLVAFLVRVGSGKLIILYFGENLLMVNIAFMIGVGFAIPISFLGSLLWAFKKEKGIIIAP
jgi:putative flippase GtrA